jgi:hypothetical protein
VIDIDNLPPFSFFSIFGHVNDTLAGPNVPNTWQFYGGGGSSTLDSSITFQNIGNFQGGSSTDTFSFADGVFPAGAISGNLDGGAGIDTLSYGSTSFWHNVPFDLAHGIAPRISGVTSNVEIVPMELSNPGSKTNQAGVPISPLPISILGGLGPFTFSATGLPAGLSIDPVSGQITGTIAETAVAGSPYTVHVSASDAYNNAAVNFQWAVQPGVNVTNPGTQSQAEGATVSLAIQASTVYGQALSYTATGLPGGLSINAQSGVISGTITVGDINASPYQVTVTATDGAHSGSAIFQWTILPSFSLVNPGEIAEPEGVPIEFPIQVNNPGNVPLTYSASGLPSYLSINSQTGVISGSVFFYYASYPQSPNYFFPVQVNASLGTSTVSTNFTWETEPGFSIGGIFDQDTFDGATISDSLSMFSPSSYRNNISIAVSGLPPGVTFDPNTALISGTIDAFADANSPYHSSVTYTNHTYNYTYTTSFNWNVAPAIVMGNPGDQSSTVGATVDLPIPVLRDFGSPIMFSASGLPSGLTIDPQTGQITGTVLPQASSPQQFAVDLFANDSKGNTGQTSFLWNVTSAQPNVVQLANIVHGGIVTITSPPGTTLTASLNYPYDFSSSTDQLDFPLGELQFKVEGVSPGGATQLTITPPAGRNWTEYLTQGPTPAKAAYHQYNFLYQHQTDSDNADTTGAEFLSNGQIVLHLVDGGRGDADLTADGAITLNGSGPAVTQLTAHIIGAPISWAPGVPITLSSAVSGEGAATANYKWEVDTYDQNFATIVAATGNQPTLTFTPPVSAQAYCVVLFTVTSADGSVVASDVAYINTPAAATAESVAQLVVSGLPSDVVSGQAISGEVAAEDASGRLIADSNSPLVVQISDDHGNTIANIPGTLNAGAFSIPAEVLTSSGANPQTDTLTITCGGVSIQSTITVHPAAKLGATLSDPTVMGVGQSFNFSVQAEDDRGVWTPSYAGAIELTYTDAGGVHDLGGGFQTTQNGMVTFTNLSLPAVGTYSLTASSEDGLFTAHFIVTVPLAIHFSLSAPAIVRSGQPFDLSLVAQDVNGQTVPSYTGFLLVDAGQPITDAVPSTDGGRHIFHNVTAYNKTVVVSDGIVSGVLNLNLLAQPSLGDFNQDGALSGADMLPMMRALADPYDFEQTYDLSAAQFLTIADVNGDGRATNADLQALLNLLRSGGGRGGESANVKQSAASAATKSNSLVAVVPSQSTSNIALVGIIPPPPPGVQVQTTVEIQATVVNTDESTAAASNSVIAPISTASVDDALAMSAEKASDRNEFIPFDLGRLTADRTDASTSDFNRFGQLAGTSDPFRLPLMELNSDRTAFDVQDVQSLETAVPHRFMLTRADELDFPSANKRERLLLSVASPSESVLENIFADWD